MSSSPPPVRFSARDARKLVLVSQQLPRSWFKRGLAGTRQAIQHLGYVQIDTISVVARAHHHTLWARVPHYRSRYIDRLVSDRSIFEYWSHAAAYLPMSDYRFCLPRMHAIANGQRHWYSGDPRLMREILSRVRAEGPLQARDFEAHRQHKGGMWDWGPVKQAIELLFMEGKLMVTRRHNFQKVFDLAERVLPANTDLHRPDKHEYAHYLIDRYLRANGIGRVREFGYLRKGMGAAIKNAALEKQESGEICVAMVGRNKAIFYVPENYEDLLRERLSRSRVRILSPFDNLLIQRRRVESLFDFEHQLECYVPAEKRKFGYFCLPVLYGDNLVALIDAKADRKNRMFIVRKLELSRPIRDLETFCQRLSREISDFARFNECDQIRLGSVPDRQLRQLLQTRI